MLQKPSSRKQLSWRGHDGGVIGSPVLLCMNASCERGLVLFKESNSITGKLLLPIENHHFFFTAEGITSSSEKTRPHSDGTGQVHAAAERAWLSSALLVWVGFNYIHLSWLPSQVHLTLPSSFQLFFLSHFFSSSLSSLSSEQAEEKNAEAKQECKERKCVQTILLHS